MYDLIKLSQPGSKSKKKSKFKRERRPKNWTPEDKKKSAKQAEEFLHVVLDAPLCGPQKVKEGPKKKPVVKHLVSPPPIQNRVFPMRWSASVKAPNPDSLVIARTMVKPGGTGTDEDAEAVATHLAVFPPELLLFARDRLKVDVVACRNAVTDYRPQLGGQLPRGWDQGSRWDNVPGVALFKTAVIATKPRGDKRIPSPTGHGSYNLVGHEFLHSFNFGRNKNKRASHDPRFIRYRNETIRRIERVSPSILRRYNINYYKQTGVAGHQESHAESGCRWFYGDQLIRTSEVLAPLADYWRWVEHELGISS